MRHTIGTRFAKAFTIIELLVVISIIGILATIVLASLSTSRAKGRDARRIADMKSIQIDRILFAIVGVGVAATRHRSAAAGASRSESTGTTRERAGARST
jgi:prepilin-type N-terminal cleavage/methylation domain-containing protein